VKFNGSVLEWILKIRTILRLFLLLKSTFVPRGALRTNIRFTAGYQMGEFFFHSKHKAWRLSKGGNKTLFPQKFDRNSKSMKKEMKENE